MNNLTQRQTIALGIVFLFGIPICIGIVVGHFTNFLAGLGITVLAIIIIAYITQRWWNKKASKNKEEDDRED